MLNFIVQEKNGKESRLWNVYHLSINLLERKVGKIFILKSWTDSIVDKALFQTGFFLKVDTNIRIVEKLLDFSLAYSLASVGCQLRGSMRLLTKIVWCQLAAKQ